MNFGRGRGRGKRGGGGAGVRGRRNWRDNESGFNGNTGSERSVDQGGISGQTLSYGDFDPSIPPPALNGAAYGSGRRGGGATVGSNGTAAASAASTGDFGAGVDLLAGLGEAVYSQDLSHQLHSNDGNNHGAFGTEYESSSASVYAVGNSYRGMDGRTRPRGRGGNAERSGGRGAVRGGGGYGYGYGDGGDRWKSQVYGGDRHQSNSYRQQEYHQQNAHYQHEYYQQSHQRFNQPPATRNGSTNGTERNNQEDSIDSVEVDDDNDESTGLNSSVTPQSSIDQQQLPVGRAADQAVDMTNQRGRLVEALCRGAYECMVCCVRIKHEARTWACGACFNLFHIHCVRKWARSPAAAAELPLPENVDKDYHRMMGWRCPACQFVSKNIPNE